MTRAVQNGAKCFLFPSLSLPVCTIMSQISGGLGRASQDLAWSGGGTQHNRTTVASELCNLEQRLIVTLLAMDNLSDSVVSFFCATLPLYHPTSSAHTHSTPLCFLLLIYRAQSSRRRSHTVKYAVECCRVECSHPQSAAARP